MSENEKTNDESGENEKGIDQTTAISGDEILRSLGIPFSMLVYCPTADALLQVTDRTSPVGLCSQFDTKTGLFLTSDESYAVRHSIQFNHQFGFDVSIPNQSVYDLYSLPRLHVIALSNGVQFQYSRNFQLFTGGLNFLHRKLARISSRY